MTRSVLATAVPMSSDTRSILLVVFLGFLVGALLFCLFLGPEVDQADTFYTGSRRNGSFATVLALTGVCLPASTLLGTTGTVSLFGYDGMFIALSVLFALALLLVLAEPLRRHGRFTIGDVFARRAWGRAPRVAAGVVTLAVCLPLLMFELASAGINTALLFGLSGSGARWVFTTMIGALIVSATVFGGMRGGDSSAGRQGHRAVDRLHSCRRPGAKRLPLQPRRPAPSRGQSKPSAGGVSEPGTWQ
ncbi:sodium:solute symporter family transporter [Streptomyces cellulosae]|uniref:sodium:solute symporter family transporter n=1 Tax=Streptomyces cellulosae TaxID=1968 RepID=UPI0006907521|nr:hypothetical protein [Streptomyces cellulosae]